MITCKECGQFVDEPEVHDMSPEAVKQRILNTVTDLVRGFMFYDRKEDEALPRGVIEDAVLESEDYSLIHEIIQLFADRLADSIGIDPAAVAGWVEEGE